MLDLRSVSIRLALLPCTLASPLWAQSVAVQTENHLVLVDTEGRVEWSMPFAGSTQVERLRNGNLMVLVGSRELVEIETVRKSVVWRYDAGSEARITSFAPLASGKVLVSAADPPHLTAIDRFGVASEPVALASAIEGLGTSVLAASVLDDGPEADLLRRARDVHRRTLTLDTHKDIRASLASPPSVDAAVDPEEAERQRLRDDPTVWGTNQVDFPKMRAGGLDVAFYIVYVGQGALDDEGFGRAREQALAKFDAIDRMCARFPDDIGLARSPADVERLAADGKLVCCIGIENGYAMGMDLGAIEEFHARGARYMSLTHNRHSQLGDSNTPADEPLHGGLSDLGRRAIAEMNRVGIMVDVSHASKETTLQAIAASKAPVIASHSGVDAVLEHGRNLSDEELRALAENGGVIQCVAFASYVKSDGGRRDFIRRTREELGLPPQRGSRQVTDDPEVRAKMLALRKRVEEFDAQRDPADVADFVDHIDYAVSVAGIDHVAISSDFDGGGGIAGWNDASETFNVTLELVRRGYSDEEVGKLWSGNTLRVWREVERFAAASSDAEGD
ncbi:MAG: dipeptidase [Planctomycetota bacterium]